MLRERFGVSERRACKVVGQHRSTQRLDEATIDEEEQRLRAWLRAFSTRRPRWGWRRAWVQARQEGWDVNRKRIQRLWRAEGLRVPYRRRKKPLRGVGVKVGAMSPIAPNVLWAGDFQFEQTDELRRRQTGSAPKLKALARPFIGRQLADRAAARGTPGHEAEARATGGC